jgi:hypothetical protein
VASSTSEVILWFGTFIAVFILAVFYLNSFFFSARPFEVVSKDVEAVLLLSNEACNTVEFSALFNPVTEKGSFVVKDNNLCINTQDVNVCRQSLCNFVEEKKIDLGKTKFLRVLKDKNSEGINIEAEALE